MINEQILKEVRYLIEELPQDKKKWLKCDFYENEFKEISKKPM